MFSPVLADPEVGRLDDLVDLDRFPIDRPHSPEWLEAIAGVRRHLDHVGAVSLPGFLRPEGVTALCGELRSLRPYVAVTRDERSAYAREGETDTPTSTWVAGHVTRDMLPPHSVAQRLYVAPGFKEFIAGCLGRQRVFEYADPLAGLVATVLPPGGQYGWHYDTNDFVVTIGVQCADEGGTFEYVPGLRRPGDENLDGLRSVLDGDRQDVRRTESEPGTLHLFLGRYSLHRVTEVRGDVDRLTLVLSFADRPGVIGPVDRTRQVYGRVTEAHLVAGDATHGADGLIR